MIFQHDTHPNHYLNYAKHPIFASVGLVEMNGGTRECTVSKLDDHTFLSSGHCVDEHLSDSKIIIEIDAKLYEFPVVGTKVPRPLAPGELERPVDEDLGVFYVDYPITQISDLNLSSLPPEKLINSNALLVNVAAYGVTGFGNQFTTYKNKDRQKFAGLMRLSPSNFAPSHEIVSIFEYFKTPNNSGLGVGIGAGDSGAPLILTDVNNNPYVIGIVSEIFANLTPEGKINPLDADLRLREADQYLAELSVPNAKPYFHYFKFPAKTDLFSGYGTQTRSTNVFPHIPFIESSKSAFEVYISNINGDWSKLQYKTLQYAIIKPISNVSASKMVSEGKKAAYFKVILEANTSLVVDIPITLDQLTLAANNSFFGIAAHSRVLSNRVSLLDGVLRIDGQLGTGGFLIERGQLKANGLIKMQDSHYEDLIKRDGYLPRALWNKQGHINQSERPDYLTIEGHYIHDRGALLSSFIDIDGPASKLAISGEAHLKGKLRVVLKPSDKSKNTGPFSLMKKSVLGYNFYHFPIGEGFFGTYIPDDDYKGFQSLNRYETRHWTILKADAIIGRFSSIELPPVAPGCQMGYEYLEQSVEVFLSCF